MNETQEQLEAMPVDQLEALVSSEGALEAPQNGEATSQGGGESVGNQQNTQEAPEAEKVPKYFQDFADNMKRELNSYRSLQGLGDKLPKLIEQQLEARMAKLQQAQNNANLSPEDQQAQAQLQEQQAALEKFVQDKADAKFNERAKDYLPVLNELIEARKDSAHRDSTMQILKDLIPEDSDKAWEAVFEQSFKDLQAGKEGALERQERLEKDPAFVAIEAVKLQRAKVQSQANQVTNQRTSQAQQAAQGVRTGGAPSSGKKAIADMSPAELDKLSVAELEAGIPEN